LQGVHKTHLDVASRLNFTGKSLAESTLRFVSSAPQVDSQRGRKRGMQLTARILQKAT